MVGMEICQEIVGIGIRWEISQITLELDRKFSKLK